MMYIILFGIHMMCKGERIIRRWLMSTTIIGLGLFNIRCSFNLLVLHLEQDLSMPVDYQGTEVFEGYIIPTIGSLPAQQSPRNANENYQKIQNRVESLSCRIQNETYHFPPFPSFIIVGAQKGGTTAMYNLLKEIQEIKGSHSEEAHFFEYLPGDPQSWSVEDICKARKRYFMLNFGEIQANTAVEYPNVLRFEKTPKYMLYPNIARKIATVVFPKPKILISVRNPVDRAFSEYRMAYSRKQLQRRNQLTASKTDQGRAEMEKNLKPVASFEMWVDKSIKGMRKKGLTKMPLFSPNITDWDNMNLSGVDDMAISLSTNVKSYSGIIQRGLYAPQIKAYLKYWTPDVDLKVIAFDDLRKDPNKTLSLILEFVGAKPHNLTIHQLSKDFSPSFSYSKEVPILPVLKNTTRSYLSRFYRPYNFELAQLLGESKYRFLWE